MAVTLHWLLKCTTRIHNQIAFWCVGEKWFKVKHLVKTFIYTTRFYFTQICIIMLIKTRFLNTFFYKYFTKIMLTFAIFISEKQF